MNMPFIIFTKYLNNLPFTMTTRLILRTHFELDNIACRELSFKLWQQLIGNAWLITIYEIDLDNLKLIYIVRIIIYIIAVIWIIYYYI